MERVQLCLDICEEQKDTSFHANLSPLFHLHPALLNSSVFPSNFLCLFAGIENQRASK